MIRASIIIPGFAVHREASYALIAYTGIIRTLPFTNSLGHLQIMGAIWWSRQYACAVSANAGVCSYLNTLFIVMATALVLEMAANLLAVLLRNFVTSQPLRIAEALTLLCTDAVVLVLTGLYGRYYPRMRHGDEDAADAGGRASATARIATNGIFLWLSATLSAVSFIGKVAPFQWERALRMLAQRYSWLQEIHMLTVTVRHPALLQPSYMHQSMWTVLGIGLRCIHT